MADVGSDLIDFVAQVGGEKNLRVEENLGEGFVRLRVAEAERRQAKHDIRCVEDIVVEMLRNSRDAGAKHIFVATTKEDSLRTLIILDDGSGIPTHMQPRIFDARVTSKLESMHMDKWGIHGRGMAMFSVKENVEEARVCSSEVGLGASIKVLSDTTRLDERTDQSTWPQAGVDDEGQEVIVRGPHNIIRTCCEFGLEEKNQCEVYFGSPAEIISAMRAYIKPTLDAHELLFVDNINTLPVLERFYVAADATELASCANECGLDVSERTIHRILAGQVKPARNVYNKVKRIKDSDDEPRKVNLLKDRRGLKIDKGDIDQFSRDMERSFKPLADCYYLKLTDDPKVKVSKNKITVTFTVDHKD